MSVYMLIKNNRNVLPPYTMLDQPRSSSSRCCPILWRKEAFVLMSKHHVYDELASSSTLCLERQELDTTRKINKITETQLGSKVCNMCSVLMFTLRMVFDIASHHTIGHRANGCNATSLRSASSYAAAPTVSMHPPRGQAPSQAGAHVRPVHAPAVGARCSQ